HYGSNVFEVQHHHSPFVKASLKLYPEKGGNGETKGRMREDTQSFTRVQPGWWNIKQHRVWLTAAGTRCSCLHFNR
uniref:Uncharacterized protein n=1 Tax=Amphiprion ocellaris TaxID=80972 RepID=A0AAQ6AAB9_AMPOC